MARLAASKPRNLFAAKARETPMPRFYFDSREGTTFVPDDEGLEFPDLDAVEREAAEAAAAIGRDRLPRGDAREIVIEVRNEQRQRVVTVTVSMHVERVHPPPVAPANSN